MKKTRRFTALLCVFCMLFTSIPSSVMSDPVPATPTDLEPLAAKPEADRELTVGDDVTVDGELDSPGEYLIRFIPEKDMNMVLLLESDAEVKATVTDESDDSVKEFHAVEAPDGEADGEAFGARLSYRARKDHAYLIRVSGSGPAAFSIRMVRRSILDAEETGEAEAEEPAEEPAGEPGEEPGGEPGETPEEIPGGEPGEVPGNGPDDESGDEPDETPGEEPGGEPEEEPGENPDEASAESPAEEEDGASGENEQPDSPEDLPAAEAGEDEPAGDPEEQPDEPEADAPKAAGPAADLELTAGEDTTATGTLDGNDYLIRFTTDENRTLVLLLTSAQELSATVTDEETGAAKALTFYETDENGGNTLILTYYKVQAGNTYLVRVSGGASAEFALRLVRRSILQAEEPEEESEEEPAEESVEEPAEEPTDEPAEEPAEEPVEEPAEEPTDEPADEPEDEPAEEPEDESMEEPADEPAEASGDTAVPASPADPEPEGTAIPATPTDLAPVPEPVTEPEPEPVTVPEPVPVTEVRIDAIESAVQAWIVFLSDSGIPQDAHLYVRELAPAEQAAYQAQTARALNAEDESYLRYTKYLEFTLLSNGKAVELNAPVKAYVTLPDIDEGADALQVVRFDDRAPVLLDSERTDMTVAFETGSLKVFGIGNALMPVTSHETELATVEVLSFSEDVPVVLAAAEDPEVIEGLEVLGTFTIEDNTKGAPAEGDQDGLYIKAELKNDAGLDPMEGVALYSVDENGNTDILMEELSGDAKITELEATQVAVIKDTGYRHLTLTVNPDDTTDDQIVTLDGMMPKGSEAAVEDVTERYSDCFAAEGEAADRTGDTGAAGETSAETEPDVIRTTLAAYEISISHSEGEYQPDEDKPISVEIMDSRIAADRNIELWHIKDDGTREQITDFTVEEGRIAFEAAGFSVYVVIEHEDGTVVTPRVEFHFISDDDIIEHDENNTVYYEGVPYEFLNRHSDIQTSQILKDGEALELIVDPPNHKITVGGEEIFRYFYGWYVVNQHEVSPAQSGKLYYDWPLNPASVNFETPISISVDNSGATPAVSWSLGSVSGTGTPDEDGTVHVYLAPIFEKYNFVNFLLYAKDTAGISAADSRHLMARKMLAMGSSGSAEVKVSDIRATSKDPAHLVFVGWEYRDETSSTGWTQILTIDSSGCERKDPGKDGVYLTVHDLEDTKSIDLYPIFVEARWVDFYVGIAGSGASYVGSEYLRSWGPAMPEGSETDEDRLNCFTSLKKSTRKGYTFDGWYAFAKVDSNTGEITNLTQPQDVTIKYIDINDNYTLKTVTVNTTAVLVGNPEDPNDPDSEVVSPNNCGTYSIGFDQENGKYCLYTDGTGQKLFSVVGGKLKFYDSLDRLSLAAKWAAAGSRITIVYWTENAQGANYTAPADEKDDYTANAVRTITTTQLNEDPALRQQNLSFASGSTIYTYQLGLFTDTEYHVSLTDPAILDDVGAVPQRADGDTEHAREEIFYELNYGLSDSYKTINGDGETIYNLYFSRKTFKLVFHIGRDNFVKNMGKQTGYTNNWLEYMYKDNKVNNVLGLPTHDRVGQSYSGVFSMVYTDSNGIEHTYDSTYETDTTNMLNDYIPGSSQNDQKLYVITAKYGAYIGDRWPSPSNPAFRFLPENSRYQMYIWTSNYNSLYCRIANDRATEGNQNGANPDINGIYRYMSAELCANRNGDGPINQNGISDPSKLVHHLVAYFADTNNGIADKRFKRYHILYEAIDGTYDPAHVTTVSGDTYESLSMTTWSQNPKNTAGDKREILGHTFYEVKQEEVISNLEPEYQLCSDFKGYKPVYSCYDPTRHDHPTISGRQEYDVYFFFQPKQHTLTFMYENEADRKTDTYYYTQSLAGANKYPDPTREGYEFSGWYTNEAGAGEPFDFANETMPDSSMVLYPKMDILRHWIKIDPNGGVIDHIDYDVATYLSGSGHNTNASTYIHPSYGTTIVEYTVERNYILLTEKELDNINNPNPYSGEKYYYINTQYRGAQDGDWGLYPDLRNAVYVKQNELGAYYSYYCSQTALHEQEQFGGYTGVSVLGYEDFLSTYVSGPYRPVEGEHYTFLGWYEVKDGKVSNMPFNFNDPVTGPFELRAKWRLDGGYYIQYNPAYYTDDGQGGTIAVIGDISGAWTDPSDHNQLYADQSPTQIREAPTNVTSTDVQHRKWVFRGWRVVRAKPDPIMVQGEEKPDWEPIELVNGEPVYYQPGDHFTIDSELATDVAPNGNPGRIIHMQAYYEPEEYTERRPLVTNLVIDANDDYHGYINTTDSTSLPELNKPGTSVINTDTEQYHNHPTQILFGDFQSSMAIHLYRYATGETHNSVTGTNFFTNENGYKLIGFDENADPEHPSTGSAYVPKFPSDGVIAVTRNEPKTTTIYAMWEPMVYVTFVNDTEGPIAITLRGTGTDTVSIVNEVTGEFARQPATTSLELAAGERIKIALPGALAGTDSITATVTNTHSQRRMSVSGEYPTGTAYGTGASDILYGSDAVYTGTLVTDATGIIVTYTEELDAQIFYNVNGGTWTAPIPPYEHLTGDEYCLDIRNIVNNAYEPTDPTPPTEKIFIGWTEYPEIAAISDFSSNSALTVNGSAVPVPEGSIQLDVVRNNYLWDFSRNASDCHLLYAVWSDAVTVTFDLVCDSNTKLHNWTGPATTDIAGPYVYYRSSSTSPAVTYTLAKGECVHRPDDPTAYTEKSGWYFVQWLQNNTSRRNTTKPTSDPVIVSNTYDFTQRVMDSNTTLSTSWTTTLPQIFTFTVENHVNYDSNEEFTYTIAVSHEKVFGKMGTNTSSNAYGDPDQKWGSVTTTLKNNETYTVQIKVLESQRWNPYTYSVEISVTDREGNLIKSGHVVYCKHNRVDGTYSGKNYTSDYKYTLTITQDAKTGYETTVGVKDRINVDIPQDYYTDPTNPVPCPETSDSERQFTFTSIHCGTSAQQNNFRPLTNEYTGDESNSLTVVFTNEAPIVAPTAYTSRHTPYVLILALGILALTLSGIGIIRKKKRLPDSEPAKATVQSHKQWVEYRTPIVRGAPPPAPRCPRAELWRGTPGKRGDAR